MDNYIVFYYIKEQDMEQISKFFQEIGYFIELHVFHKLEHIRLNDIFDLLILTAIFYMLFKFILNKRAARLALGLVILVLVMALAFLFNMKGVMMFFETFYQVGMVAVIIMFQPELRSALEKVGGTSLRGIKNISDRNGTMTGALIEEFTEAVFDLAKTKTGALIVFERNTKLGDIILTGTVVNAQFSGNLLKSIFFNKAPDRKSVV